MTALLRRWSRGEAGAEDDLHARVYDELRSLAHAYLRRERRGHTLETSALVHEAYLRLVDQKRVEWRNRAHFYAIAATMMRRILSNYARDRRCDRRGGSAPHLSLEEAPEITDGRMADWAAVDEALVRLHRVGPQRARVVELRFFGGMTAEEMAEVLGVSVPTVRRRWRVARAWLYRELTEGSAV